MARTAIVTLVVLAALAAVGLPATATTPAQNGLIVYAGYDSHGRRQLFTISPSGTGARQLTASAGENFFPAWSSDGRRIAFTSTRAGTPELWVMDAGGNRQRALTRPPVAGGFVPSWSPDGRHIVFSAMVGVVAHPEIWKIDTDGSNLLQLTSTATPGGSNAPSWSPDGARLAFWSGFEALFGQVWVMGADGSRRRALTQCRPPSNCDNPAWSPDGRLLLYETNQGEGQGAATWVMDVDGSRQHRLLPFPYGAGRQPWQPVRGRRS